MIKRVRNIIIFGSLFGGILLLLRFVFKLSEEMVWKYYIIASVIIIAGAMIINITWQMKLMKKIKSLAKLLKEEESTDKFIEENEKLLHKLKSNYNRNIININLSAGYCAKGDYETAKSILMSISLKHLKGVNKVVYYVNLAYIHFRLEENQKALSILELQKKDFACFEKSSSLGGSIAILRIFQYIVQNQLEEANNSLNMARKKWTDKRLLEDWEFLQSKINVML